MSDLTDVVTQLQQIAQQMGLVARILQNRVAVGTFTMPAANTSTISNTAVAGNSVIQLIPTNAAAATLMGSAKMLVATPNAGSGFTVTTANSASAAGTETFQYTIYTPI